MQYEWLIRPFLRRLPVDRIVNPDGPKKVTVFRNCFFSPYTGGVYLDKRTFYGPSAFQPNKVGKIVSLGRYLNVRQVACATVIDHGPWDNHYHWLIDSIPRLWGLIREQVPSEGEIFLPTARKMAAHERKLIECLLPKNLVLVSVSRFVLFSADTFIFLPFLSSIRSGRLPADYLSYFRRKVYSAYGIKASRPQLRLFISRRSNPKRQFENQDEVERFFVNQGFLCLQLEQIPIGRQIECFANANVVVGSHGAGLTNIIFSPVTCKVVEIFHSADSKHLCHYRDLADAVGLSYFSVFLDAEDKDARAHLPVEIVRDILHNLNEPKG